MKNVGFVCIILFFGFVIKAQSQVQVKPLYLLNDRIVADSTLANAYAVYGKLSSGDLWIFKKYDLDNQLLVTGSFRDSLLTVPHGEFSYYDDVYLFDALNYTHFAESGKERYLVTKGTFDDGARIGRWTSYFPDGKIKEYCDYQGDKPNGKYALFNLKGILQLEGNFVDGEKDGEWVSKRGKKVERYRMGKLQTKDKQTPIKN